MAGKHRSGRSQGREIHQIETNTRLRRVAKVPLMGRKDRTPGDTIVPRGELQREGTWNERRNAPADSYRSADD